MLIDEIIEFIETDTLSASFSTKGLKYLSLKEYNGEEIIDLKNFDFKEPHNPMINLLIRETINFFEIGSHNMPLDLTDLTQFQKDVLKAACGIKPGEIYTYKELAIKIGSPDAARAVGNALSKNPVAYFIPTHRILPKKGIGTCKNGAWFLRNKLLIHEGHDIDKLRNMKRL